MEAKQIALIDAVAADKLERIKKALADGGDPARPLTRQEYSDWFFKKYPMSALVRQPWAEDRGKSPERGFHIIFEARSYDVFELLANKGADLKAVDARHGTSILHHVLNGGSLEMRLQSSVRYDVKVKRRLAILKLLLELGVEADFPDKASGRTALHAAASYYPKWPLDKGWWLEGGPVQAEEGKEPGIIELWGAQEAVEALVRAGADPNALNPRNGYTPMHWASVYEREPYLECPETLYKFGGKVSPPDRAGRRPMDFTVPKNDKKAARLKKKFSLAARKEAGEDIETQTAAALAAFRFESPQIMMWDAVFYNDVQTLQTALAAGADPNLPMNATEYEAWLYRVNCGTPYIDIDENLFQLQFYVIYEALKYSEILKIILDAGADTGVINGHTIMVPKNWTAC